LALAELVLYLLVVELLEVIAPFLRLLLMAEDLEMALAPEVLVEMAALEEGHASQVQLV
jgi:hypothetical protein